MDVTSFQYQQAIQQITAQEQGEAGHMLDVFRGLWFKENHIFLWGTYDGVRWLTEIGLGVLLLLLGCFLQRG